MNDLHLLSRVRALTKYKMVADELRKREASGKRMGAVDLAGSGRASDPARILVIDDDPGLSEVVQLLLAGEGYRTEMTGTVRDGLRAGIGDEI